MSRKPTSLEALMAGQRLDAADNVVAFVRPPKAVEKLTVYLPRTAAKRLKQMALDNDRRVNDLLQEGVDLMLAKHGQPSLKEFGE